ncbi:MAG: EamA family transporter [Armatimonadota bacterium]|nr:EamA family transporter [Armatimonadota bacterium]
MRWRGVVAVVAAATLWGIAGVVAKSLFVRHTITPEAIVEIRVTAGLALTAVLLRLQGLSPWLPRSTVVRLIPLGIGMVVSQSMYYLTISLADVATAIFLQYTAPAVVVAYTAIVQRERLSASQIACLAGALAGGYLLVVGPQGLTVSAAAVVAGSASALGFAGWILVGRSANRLVGPWHMLFYGLLIGSLVWSVYVPPWDAYLQSYTVGEWALIVYIVVFATVTPFALFLYGLRFIDSRSASLTATIEPVVAAVVAAAWLGEALAGRAIAGAVLILASVISLQLVPVRPASRR